MCVFVPVTGKYFIDVSRGQETPAVLSRLLDQADGFTLKSLTFCAIPPLC